ncbi:EIF3C [Mytilus coruscus]|uniref:EIF3C n=1 Tax=Mytilus coruscus TaxID=42192 RepID=A0A6J8CW33_MYTCO|nr:EIF3C [Mytilus coruscus]
MKKIQDEENVQRCRDNVAHEFDARRRVISKNFHHILRLSERQAFPGPPEGIREHVVATSKAMTKGNWKECQNFIINDKMNAKASLDEPTRTVVMHPTEPIRLQSLALQLSEKVSSLVDNSEKIMEFKQGNFGFQKTNQNYGGYQQNKDTWQGNKYQNKDNWTGGSNKYQQNKDNWTRGNRRNQNRQQRAY